MNLLGTRKREHSRKALLSAAEGPDVIEACSTGPRLELFAQGARDGWVAWGNQAKEYEIGWETYAHNSRLDRSRDACNRQSKVARGCS